MNKFYQIITESKEKRGENSDFWFLGWTVMADIFGRIYLGSKKFSQMHCLDVTTQPNEPDQLLKEVKFPRFSEKNPD